MRQAAGLLGGGEGLGDERPGPAAARADAAEPNVQFIVACHHVPSSEVRCCLCLQ
jgi:hypothetical protein